MKRSGPQTIAVVIIGAGPAGRAAALTLAGLGIGGVTLVDAAAEPLKLLADDATDATQADLIDRRQATAFHAEAHSVWLQSAEGIEQIAWSHLILATGASAAFVPDPESGSWVEAGWLPETRLAAALGCAHDFDAVAQWLLPVLQQATCETTVADVFVVGAARGGLGEQPAAGDGARCAFAIAARVRGEHSPPTIAASPDRREWVSSWHLVRRVSDPFVVCPCNGVSAGEAREAIRAGADTLHSLGQFSGAGGGHCRGRRCSLALAHMLVEETGLGLAHVLTAPAEFPAVSIPVDHFAEITRERPAMKPPSRDEGHL